MTNPDQVIESVIVSAGANVAPRITPADIAKNIADEYYFTAYQGASMVSAGPIPGELSLLTFCVLILQNGFTVTGESACASPENYNKAIGQRIARENAVAKIWPLMGYELRTKLSNA